MFIYDLFNKFRDILSLFWHLLTYPHNKIIIFFCLMIISSSRTFHFFYHLSKFLMKVIKNLHKFDSVFLFHFLNYFNSIPNKFSFFKSLFLFLSLIFCFFSTFLQFYIFLERNGCPIHSAIILTSLLSSCNSSTQICIKR